MGLVKSINSLLADNVCHIRKSQSNKQEIPSNLGLLSLVRGDDRNYPGKDRIEFRITPNRQLHIPRLRLIAEDVETGEVEGTTMMKSSKPKGRYAVIRNLPPDKVLKLRLST